MIRAAIMMPELCMLLLLLRSLNVMSLCMYIWMQELWTSNFCNTWWRLSKRGVLHCTSRAIKFAQMNVEVVLRFCSNCLAQLSKFKIILMLINNCKTCSMSAWMSMEQFMRALLDKNFTLLHCCILDGLFRTGSSGKHVYI